MRLGSGSSVSGGRRSGGTAAPLVGLAVAVGVAGCFVDRTGAAGTGDPDAGPMPCADGGCGPRDDDGDGVATDVDCDDADPTVGRMAERACESACASGLERCADGSWADCDAPTDCSCTSGDTRDLDCARCGTRRQRCDAGSWVDDGGCAGQGPCGPGDVESEEEACGACGSGSRSRSRTCSASCAWEAWSDWSACGGETGCTPGETDTETEACGGCGEGTRSRSRTCAAGCDWGGWSDWSTCSATSACTPGDTDTESQSCGCGGTQSRSRTCTASCAWGAWSGWGPCTGGGSTGECVPGSADVQTDGSCGACGGGTRTRSRTCSVSSCEWGSWSSWSMCIGDTSCHHDGRDYCPCEGGGTWTCCMDGTWSNSGCAGCP